MLKNTYENMCFPSFYMVFNFCIDRIIEPLASRCVKFRFQPLSSESILARLQMIAEAEGVAANDEVSVCLCTKKINMK
jgi:replication factor C subunit 2/4